MKVLIRVMLALVVFAAATGEVSMAAVFQVTDGTELQAALDTARENGEDDVIYLQKGDYAAGPFTYGTTNNDSMAVTLSGGWNSSFTSQSSRADDTELNGGGANPVLQIFADALGVDITFAIENLTIKNGYTSGTDYSGAGILAYTGGDPNGSIDLTIRDCLFQNNNAANSKSGGGIYSNCTLKVYDTEFLSNSGNSGGAMFISYDSDEDQSACPLIDGCYFADNSNYGNQGNTIWHNCTLQVSNCIFKGRLDGVSSSGIGSTIWGNYDSHTKVANCVFKDIRIKYWGSAIQAFRGSMDITNCLFANNEAGYLVASPHEGYGVIAYYHSGGTNTINITNCTFVGNRAYQTGYAAIHNRGATVNVENCIFWDNEGETGIWNHLDGSGTVTMKYCNYYPGSQGMGISVTDGGGNFNTNPQFIVGDDYLITPSSPCIDRGDNSLVAADIHDLDGDSDTSEATPLDIKGHPRFYDDPCTADTGSGTAPIVDVGAYEFIPIETNSVVGGYNLVLWGSDHATEFTSGIGYADFDGSGSYTAEITEVSNGQTTGEAFLPGKSEGTYVDNGDETIALDGYSKGYTAKNRTMIVWAPVPGDAQYEETGINVALKQGYTLNEGSLDGRYNFVRFGSNHNYEFSSGNGYIDFDGSKNFTGEITEVVDGPSGGAFSVGDFNGTYSLDANGALVSGPYDSGCVSWDGSLVVWTSVPGDLPSEETGTAIGFKVGSGMSNGSLYGTYNYVVFGSDHATQFSSGLGYLTFDGSGGFTGEILEASHGQPKDTAFDVGFISGKYSVGSDGKLTLSDYDSGYVSADGSVIAWVPIPGDAQYEENGIAIGVRGEGTSRFGSYGGNKSVKLTLEDCSGVPVTFSIGGAGYGKIDYGDCGFGEITLYDTDEKSMLMIKSKGLTSVGDILIHGDIKGINAKTVDVRDSIDIDGSCGMLMLHDIDAGHEINIGPTSNPKTAVKMKLGRVGDTYLNSQTPIKMIMAAEWIGGAIEAPWVGSIMIKGDSKRCIIGDFDATVNLSGAGAPSGVALKKVKIAGRVLGGKWWINGHCSSAQMAACEPGFEVHMENYDLGALKVMGNKKVGINGVLSGELWCNSVKSILACDIVDGKIVLGQKPAYKVYALGKLMAKSWINNSEILSDGHVGTVMTGGIRDSACFAGVTSMADLNGDGVYDLPDPAIDIDYVERASIKSIKIKGIKGETYSLINSNMAAAEIKSAYLAYPNTDNGGKAFGMAADFIKSLTIKTDGPTIKYKNLDEKDTIFYGDAEIRLD